MIKSDMPAICNRMFHCKGGSLFCCHRWLFHQHLP